MTMRQMLLITLLSTLSIPAQYTEYGETRVKASEYEGSYNIGLAAGFVSGFGLSYRRWIDNTPYGYQITAAPFYSENKKSGEKTVNMSLGLNGLYRLHMGRTAGLYLYYGAHGWYYFDRVQMMNYTWDYYSGAGSVDTGYVVTEKKVIQGGFGPGVDLNFWRLSCNFQFGLRAGYDYVWQETSVGLTAETAFYYRF